MSAKATTDALSIPATPQETASWLRMLAREVNTFVLFLQTWSAMGFLINPEVTGALVGLQTKVVEARAALGKGEGASLGTAELEAIAAEEEAVYRQLTEEIKRFKEESEGIFPAFKLNFDPCF